MKVVIFAGGRGTRISEESVLRPKPMIEIGGKPILWHIMKIYAAYGHTEFIICLGYKGWMIKEYFTNYFLHNADLTVDLSNNTTEIHQNNAEPFKISLIDTGLETMTAGRLKRVLPYTKDEPFMLTYGDGVCDVDLDKLLAFHQKSGKICTMTAIQAQSRFGIIKMQENGTIQSFEEKPEESGTWINGGFFVIEPEIKNYLHETADNIMWEQQPLHDLAAKGQIAAYRHHDFWKCMDTMRDKLALEEMWGFRSSQMEKNGNNGNNACPELSLQQHIIKNVMPFPTYFKDKKVFLTGHTGFKGSWLLLMLNLMGAEVKGYALPPENEGDLYCQIEGDKLCYSSVFADIRDEHLLKGEIIRFEPDIIIHLAAQPLVRRSYEYPVDTFNTNVMGTVHVLDALRELRKPCTGVMITTDKVYDNKEKGRAFVETDKLGGHDPYSSSKAAAEIAVAAYRKSYFTAENYSTHQKAVIALRAGNVIGGGDYAEDRIIPDIVRSIKREKAVSLRNPNAIRPWQHVLEPLAIYLKIAERLSVAPSELLPAYNIGPDADDVLDVATVTKKFIQYYGKGKFEFAENASNPHEAGTLILDNSAIKRDLGWQPKFKAEEAIKITAEWYADQELSALEKMEAQIRRYYE